MSCAKQKVICRLVLLNGEVIEGENACLEPQDSCPREPGEGYHKCESICRQQGHAEQQAVRNAAGKNLKGATATLSGHTYFCADCQHVLFDAGVEFLSRGVSK